MDNTGPSPGAADQSIEGSSGAAPFTGSVVPTENPTTLVKMSVSELAGDDEDRRLVDQAQSGVSSWLPPVTHGAMDTLPLSVPFKGGVALDHPSTQGTKNPAGIAGTVDEDRRPVDQAQSGASLGVCIEDGPETVSVPPCECSREPARVLFVSVTFGVRVRPGKSTIGHGGTMQPDTATRLTQGVPGAPGVGHATAFFLVEEHDSSLGDERASTASPARFLTSSAPATT